MASSPARVNETAKFRLLKSVIPFVAILLVLWLLGMIGTYTIGAWLHLLLVIALIVLIIQLVTGRTSAV